MLSSLSVVSLSASYLDIDPIEDTGRLEIGSQEHQSHPSYLDIDPIEDTGRLEIGSQEHQSHPSYLDIDPIEDTGSSPSLTHRRGDSRYLDIDPIEDTGSFSLLCNIGQTKALLRYRSD